MAKDHQLILKAVPCDTNFHPSGPQTASEAKRLGRQICPYFSNCNTNKCGLHEKKLQCAISFGVDVARYAIQEKHSVEEEMKDFRRDLADKLPVLAANGFIWSEDRQNFEIIEDLEEGIKKIENFAKQLLGEEQAASLPASEKCCRSFGQLVSEAVTSNGAIDLGSVEAREGSCGYNGGRGCDVTRGPCSCGAWH